MSHSKMLRLQILFLAPLFFLPATDVIIRPAYEQWKHEKAETQKTAGVLVQYVAASEGQLKDESRLLLTVVSKSAPVVNGDAESCRSLFADILKNQPAFNNIGAADLNGDVFCDTAGSASSNIADREYFQRAVGTRRFVFSDYVPARSTGRHPVEIAYPYSDETGRPKGVIFASLDLKALGRIPEKSLPENGVLLIVDSKGTVLARHPDAEEWIGRPMPQAPVIKAMLAQKEGVAQEKDLDGVVRNFSFASVTLGPPGELHIAAGFTEKPFNWLSEDMLKNAASLLGLMILFAFAAGWFAARHLPAEK